MAAGKKIRLFKIASEINIGKDAIIEFLNSKGFKIQNKPTAVLNEDMLEAVYEKFKKEKQAIEKQREKLEKHKKVRKPADKEAEEGTEEEAKAAGAKEAEEDKPLDKPAVKEVAVPEEEAQKEEKSKKAPKKESQTEKVAKKEPEKAKDEPKEEAKEKPKQEVKAEPQKVKKDTKETTKAESGDNAKASKKAVKEDKKAEEKTEVKVEKKTEPIEEAKKEAEPKKAVKSEKKTKEKAEAKPAKEEKTDKTTKAKAKKEKTEPKAEEKADKEQPVLKIEFQTEAKDHQFVLKPEESEQEKAKTPEDLEELKKIEDELARAEELEGKALGIKKKEKSSGRKKKKRRKLAEVELDKEGKAPQLRGLTIVGKIELQQQNKEKSQKDKKADRFAGVDDEKAPGSKRSKRRKKQKAKVLDIEETAAAPSKKSDKKRRKKKSVRDMIKSEDVDAAIKKTLAGMEVSGSAGSRAKMRQKKKAEREVKELKKIEEQEKEAAILELTEFVTTSDLANLMGVSANDIILKCMELGLMVSINQRLDKDTITLIADDYGFQIEFLDEKAVQSLDDDDDDDDEMEPRSPIVTIMGHVDHGKTSLLDYIRHANVVAGESGGITQHIGAYRVELGKDKYITFLDTPGHEAFTAMRARGAQVTDLVVLVVAADDSVMPQTLEAISHAQAANVPIVVAINKIDKPDAQPDRIKQQLADQNILVEDWGGTYQSVEISAKAGINVDLLLEKILLEAELLDLKANPDRAARAAVVEANMDKGLGVVSTVIVQKGTLRVGDPFIAGVYSGKIRAMFDERGRKVEEAGPSIPVRAIGFDGLPEAGDILVAVDSDAEAKVAANQRSQRKREQEFRQVRHVTLDDISQQIQIGGVKDLYLVIKADVSGSAEALSDSLLKLSSDEVRVNILHKGVGSITESDVMLAAASGAVIVGFHVSPTAKARKTAEAEKVDIRLYSIIYDCINEIRLALEGLLTPDTEEEITSTVEIRRIFKISKTGVIGGCHVMSGKITRNDRVKVLRDGLPVYNGTLHSLKREKDDVKEVDAGYECGIMLEGFQDIQVGDVIEGYKIVEIKRTLSQ